MTQSLVTQTTTGRDWGKVSQIHLAQVPSATTNRYLGRGEGGLGI